MGKKRNNAAKKKQAAKKKRLSSAYGVSVLKGGTLTQNNGVIDKNALVAAANGNGSKSQPQHNGKKNSGEARSNNDNGEGNTKNIVDSKIQPGKRPRGSPNGENDDFDRLHASLEERSLALHARNEEQRRSKKGGRQKQQKKGWGKFAQPSSAVTNFAPATLTLAPKSTQQLVDDTANQVALGMNEIGQSQSSSSTMTNPLLDGPQSSAMGIAPTPGKSSLATAASLNWKLRVSNVTTTQQQKQQESEQSKKNSFAALDFDSDSDNEWTDTKKGKIVQQFQFKPASFSFQSSTVPNPSQQLSADDDDIDPDL